MSSYQPPMTATAGKPSVVAGIATNVVLLPENRGRKGASVFNDSTAILYLLCGESAASTTFYTTQVAPYGYYEVPYGYSGPIRGLWASATGNARITEFI